MSLFENFPYTNLHDLNLDWIIKMMKDLETKFDIAITSKITVANPIQWDITKQYEAYTIVMNDDIAYLSMQAVPYGVSISDADYWNEIFDLSDLFTSLKSAISFNDDGNSTTSSANRAIGSLVWLNDELYHVTASIAVGDTYSSDNVEPVSIEELLSAILQNINSLSSSIANLDSRTSTAREFILIGDSFGGGVDGDDNTHTVTGGGWIQRFKDATAGWAKVYNNQTPLGGVYGFASSRPFLDVLQDAEQYIPDKKKITDIVVLGGTNDIGKTKAQIEAAIETFVEYCHDNYPHARLSIGPLGTNVLKMVTDIHAAYSTCLNYGAEYISDLRALFCMMQYIGSDNIHLNAAGYAFYQKYITEAILTGNSDWCFNETTEEALTIDSSFSTVHNLIRFTYNVSNKIWSYGLMGFGGVQTQGVANMVPVSASATTDVSFTTQNMIKPFGTAGERFQAIFCSDGKFCELYMDENRAIHIVRPYGMSSSFNAFAKSYIRSFAY